MIGTVRAEPINLLTFFKEDYGSLCSVPVNWVSVESRACVCSGHLPVHMFTGQPWCKWSQGWSWTFSFTQMKLGWLLQRTCGDGSWRRRVRCLHLWSDSLWLFIRTTLQRCLPTMTQQRRNCLSYQDRSSR